jgi:hypothetical protein
VTKAIIFCFIASLATSSARAADAPSVVVVEAMKLPSHLEAFHARLKFAVGQVLDSAGWTRVTNGAENTGACSDVSCAGELARTARAQYALVLDGKYGTTSGVVPGYDVRVQLWNAQAKDQPIAMEQGRCEDCTAPELLVYVQGLLSPLVGAENKKRAEVAEALAAPVPPTPAISPEFRPSPPPARDGRGYLIPVGWTVVGVGVVAVTVGGWLLWSDGRLQNCADGSCASVRHTHAGLPLVIGGAAAVALGVGALVYHHHKASDITFRIGPTSLALGGRF